MKTLYISNICILILLVCCKEKRPVTKIFEENPMFKEIKTPRINDEVVLTGSVGGALSSQEDLLLYSTWDATVNIYDADDREMLLEIPVANVPYSAPVLKENLLYFSASNESYVCYDLENQKKLWSYDSTYRLVTRVYFIQDSIIMLGRNSYGMTALHAYTGEKLYELKCRDPKYKKWCEPCIAPWPVSYDTTYTYISNHRCDDLIKIESTTGKIIWRKSFGLSSPFSGKAIVIGDKLFLGINNFPDNEGSKIVMLDKETGDILYEECVLYDDHVESFAYEGKVYFYSYDEKINVFDSNTNELKELLDIGPKGMLGGRFHRANNFIFLINGTNKHLIQINMETEEVRDFGYMRYKKYVFSYGDTTYFVR